MKRIAKASVWWWVWLSLIGALSGCNTVEGLCEDIAVMSEATRDAMTQKEQ